MLKIELIRVTITHTVSLSMCVCVIDFGFLFAHVNLLTSWDLAGCSCQSICAVSPHRALIAPVIRFVTINPIMLLSPSDAMPNKSSPSQPKWVCAHTMHVLSAIFTFSHVFFFLHHLSVCLSCPLSESPLFSFIPILIKISFPRCFLSFFKDLIFPHLWHSQDNVIDHAEYLKHCFGWWSQCNPFYPNQNSLHYIRQMHRSAIHLSFSEKWLQ